MDLKLGRLLKEKRVEHEQKCASLIVRTILERRIGQLRWGYLKWQYSIKVQKEHDNNIAVVLQEALAPIKEELAALRKLLKK